MQEEAENERSDEHSRKAGPCGATNRATEGGHLPSRKGTPGTFMGQVKRWQGERGSLTFGARAFRFSSGTFPNSTFPQAVSIPFDGPNCPSIKPW